MNPKKSIMKWSWAIERSSTERLNGLKMLAATRLTLWTQYLCPSIICMLKHQSSLWWYLKVSSLRGIRSWKWVLMNDIGALIKKKKKHERDALLLHHIRIQKERCHLQARKRALTKYGIYWPLNPGFPNLQYCDK